MASIFLGLSHKGGTGRSVSLANIGYCLASAGCDVCIVDLDLGSPTMGTVLHIEEDLPAGRKEGKGVHSFMRSPPTHPGEVESALVPVWGREVPRPSDDAGSFCLLPGTRDGDISLDVDGIRKGLRRIFDDIGGRFDFILADLRSGLSNVALALTQDEFAQDEVTWLFFYRWTPQHLVGLDDLAERVAKSYTPPDTARVGFVRTAFSDPKNYQGPLQRYVLKLNAELAKTEQRAQDRVEDALVLGSVPHDHVLQWDERILDEEDERRGSKDTVDSFRSIAEVIRLRERR